MELKGTESGRLTDRKGRRMPYELTLTVSVGGGRPARITEVILRPLNAKISVNRDAIKALEAGLDDFADYVAAKAIANWHAENRTRPEVLAAAMPYLTFPESNDDSETRTLAVGPRFIEELMVDLRRRRRSGDQDRLVAVAKEYALAQERGVPVGEAIASKFMVSRSHADNLIREARKRGLLPPFRPGRTQASATKATPNPRKTNNKRKEGT